MRQRQRLEYVQETICKDTLSLSPGVVVTQAILMDCESSIMLFVYRVHCNEKIALVQPFNPALPTPMESHGPMHCHAELICVVKLQ